MGGNFSPIELVQAPALTALLPLGASVEEKAGLADAAAKLKTHAPLLGDYFTIRLNAEGKLTHVPEVISGHMPSSVCLPKFLRDLSQVDFTSEQAFLDGVCHCL